jgi:secreted PhoX family phosphatase
LNKQKTKSVMRKSLQSMLVCFGVLLVSQIEVKAQIVRLQDYVNKNSARIGTFQDIDFHEAGFSGLYPIAGTNGTEFWTVSDRGVNVDAASANPSACRPTYDKIYGFQNYAPKIHRIRVHGDSIQILQTITMKRPDGSGATGVLNPTGFGSTSLEEASTDTVLTCANFSAKIAPKDVWGIDSEGIVVDKQGNFWICEEGGPTIWKLNSNGVVLTRFTPYGNLTGIEPQDIAIDAVFATRKNNRGFESIAITPSGKIYALIQSPLLNPTKAVGEATQVHRLIEIDPATNATKVFVYLNDGVIGTSGPDQIRLSDWKLSDMAAISDSTFLVIEAALRGTRDVKNIYKINIKDATPVTSALYNGSTVEGLVNLAGLTTNSIVPVKKTLFADMFSTEFAWDHALEKAEGIAIINDSTIAIVNDNDYGQASPTANGVATATGIKSHLVTYRLKGTNKLTNYKTLTPDFAQGITGISTSTTPYMIPSQPGVEFTSLLSVQDAAANGYKMVGIPDGLGAYDNGNGTFTVLMNHELGNTQGAVRAHGSAGAFVSKWVIKKSDLSVVSGSDLIQNVNVWNGTGYTTYNATTPNALAAFNRFCSADLPAVSAFYNSATGLGTQERIFMNGEESGKEGRAMAHIATGPNAGVTYELPALGKYSYENAVASPASGTKTVVVGLDDETGGQVYVYVGTKTTTGNEVDKAGLTNGKLYGVKVTGLAAETSASIPAAGTVFTMVDLGDVKNTTGAALETNSANAAVTAFLRPEDGAWDPKSPNNFYFVTTNSISSPSRLWRLTFTDVSNPELGGTITAVLDGTEGHKMLDNITIDNYGHVLMVEDVGGNAHIGKTWQYTIATDGLKEIASHDNSRFVSGAPNFLTIDEEATGILDAEDILGKGMFIVAVQAHYNIPGEFVQGGQLLVFTNPDTKNSSSLISTGKTGVSTSQNPYMIPSQPGVEFTSLLSVQDAAANGYKMVGIPDGLGAYDNGNGTFTVLMNHELGNTQGAVRAHGSAGAFVSKWVIKKSDLSVVSGADLIQNVNVWNGTGYTTYNATTPNALAAFGRFCSADLPAVSAFYNSATSLGTQERIFMNGEETGKEGRAMAHIATGPNAGVTYELPALGKYSYENAVASPASGKKTVVVGLDDETGGQVYVYVGTKTTTGNEVDKAGLTNGKLYGVKVTGLAAETSASIPAAGTVFTMVDLGDVKNTTGAALETNSANAAVTAFLRPEDGAWDPKSPNNFYFVTTNSITSPSRLWRLTFTDVSNPELGGTITAVLDGTEGHKMLDNIAIDNYGHVLMVEDVGGNAHIGKTWQYTIATDALKEIASHDNSRFVTGAPNFLTIDEEATGILDAEDILGKGMFIVAVQAHYNIPGEFVQGGQLLVFTNPDTKNATPLTTGVEVGDSKNVNIKLYPNPANGLATISLILDNNEQITVSVYDVQGREVLPSVKKNLESGEQNILLNTSSLSNGTYIVEITTETYSEKIRVVVMH